MLFKSFRRPYPSIRMRIAIVISIFALIPSACTGFLLHMHIVGQEREQRALLVRETVGDMAKELEMLVRTAENTARTLSIDRAIRTAYNRFQVGVSLGEEMDLFHDVTDRLTILRVSGVYDNLRVYLPDSQLMTREQVSLFGSSQLDKSGIPPAALEGGGMTGWFGPYDRRAYAGGRFDGSTDYQIVSFYRKTFQADARDNIIVVVDYAVSDLQAVLERAADIRGSFRIFSPGGLITQLDNGLRASGLRLTAQASGWRIEADVDERQLYYGSGMAVLIIVSTLLVCGLLIPTVATATARQISRGLSALSAASGQICDGAYDEIPVDGKTLEIRNLQNAFNRMLRQMHTLIHDVYEAKIARQGAQLRSLSEQIKPHFLYNTLECGKWMALKNKDEETAQYIEMMSQLFRLSLSMGEDFVPLSQELKHTRLYVHLMNARSRRSIELVEQLETALSDIKIVKLLLQPLVENAMEHGIMQSERPGVITVRAWAEKADLAIVIEDNGLGFPAALLPVLNSGRSSGYGIQNTMDRLRLCYGERCGIRFENREIGGAVSIRLPLFPAVAEPETARRDQHACISRREAFGPREGDGSDGGSCGCRRAGDRPR